MATFQTFRESFPSDPNRKGRLFETFLCDTFFGHEPMFKAKFKRVWRFSEWPGRWSGRDIGTDLIAEDTEGKKGCKNVLKALNLRLHEDHREVSVSFEQAAKLPAGMFDTFAYITVTDECPPDKNKPKFTLGPFQLRESTKSS